MAKEMTLEDAIRILKGSFSSPYYAEAKHLVEREDPNNDILKQVKLREEAFAKEHNIESDDVEMYFSNAESLRDNAGKYYTGQFAAKKSLGDLFSRINVYEHDAETGRDVLVVPERKDDYLKLFFEAKKIETAQALVGSKEYASKTAEEKEALYRQAVNERFFAGVARLTGASAIRQPDEKEQVIGSKENVAYVKEQADLMERAVQNAMTTGGKVGIHSDDILISVADTAENTQSFFNQLKEKARKLGGQASEKLNQVAVRFMVRKDRLEEKADLVSKGKYKKTIKPAIIAMKDKAIDEIWRYGGTIASSVAFGVAVKSVIAAGAGASFMPVAIGYGVYHAASSWVYPVLAEKRKLCRLAKEQGQKLPSKVAFKQAWKNLHEKKEGEKMCDYRKQGLFNTVLGLGGGVVLGKVLNKLQMGQAILQAGKEGADVAKTARMTALGARSLSPAAVQLTDAGASYLMNPNDPTNRFRAKQKAINGGVAALFGIGTMVVSDLVSGAHSAGAHEAVSSHVQSGTTGGYEPYPFGNGEGDGYLWQPNGDNSQGLWNNGSSDFVSDPNSVPAEPVSTLPEPYHFPEKWDPNAKICEGLTERQYGRLFSTMEGTLDSGLRDAQGNAISLANASRHLTPEVMEEVFPGKTEGQVLYGYNRLYGFMRRAVQVGTDELGRPHFRERSFGFETFRQAFENQNIGQEDALKLAAFSMEHSNESKLDLMQGIQELYPDMKKRQISGLADTIISNRRFWQHGEEMEGLIKLLGCGEKPSPELAKAMNDFLNDPDGFINEEVRKAAERGAVNHNYFVGHTTGCGEEGGEWIGRAPEPAPAPEPEPEPEPRPQLMRMTKGPNLVTELEAPKETIKAPEPVTPPPPAQGAKGITSAPGTGINKVVKYLTEEEAAAAVAREQKLQGR